MKRQLRRLGRIAGASLLIGALAAATGWAPAGAGAANTHGRQAHSHGRHRRRVAQPPRLGASSTARTPGFFGPFQTPDAFPSKWPAPYQLIYRWSDPVTTYNASIANGDITTVDLKGLVHNRDGEVLSVWFEYGKTRDALGSTEKQNPRMAGNDDPVAFGARLRYLEAATRYFWRAAAKVKEPDGSEGNVYGTIGSFVTRPYPNLDGVADPCDRLGGHSPGAYQITESLTIACSQMYKYENTVNKYSPVPLPIGYSGRIECTREYPRNLNSGADHFLIPKINYTVSLDHIVNYWRSNNSNRFTTFFGNQKNSEGLQEGPIPGWHEWNVDQWGEPFTNTSTDVQFWINCTQNWKAISADQLARGEGDDRASETPPSAPRDVKAVRAPDGGIDVTWQPPSSLSPSGVAGYDLIFRGWKKGDPKVLLPNTSPRALVTGLEGHIYPDQVTIVRQAIPVDYELGVAVAAVSREGSMSDAAVVDWR